MRAALLLSLLTLCACDIARAVDAGMALGQFIVHTSGCQHDESSGDDGCKDE